ncbi:unnamed protein product [Protopolystoma xenopodis]|uniref:UTP25 NTP hydrolase-like domain-containing protein n=1 Tax=Protopolystoma xenopodis TaxID=117903 RepID=A0A3S5CNR0_9PLAT|nr:unnamed protein product [Protopolystoma xenopodis]
MFSSHNSDKELDLQYITASLEMLVIDYAELLFMQNWSLVASLISRLNQRMTRAVINNPARVRLSHLAGLGARYRQTILFSAAFHYLIAASIGECSNFQGLVLVLPSPYHPSVGRLSHRDKDGGQILAKRRKSNRRVYYSSVPIATESSASMGSQLRPEALYPGYLPPFFRVPGAYLTSVTSAGFDKANRNLHDSISSFSSRSSDLGAIKLTADDVRLSLIPFTVASTFPSSHLKSTAINAGLLASLPVSASSGSLCWAELTKPASGSDEDGALLISSTELPRAEYSELG